MRGLRPPHPVCHCNSRPESSSPGRRPSRRPGPVDPCGHPVTLRGRSLGSRNRSREAAYDERSRASRRPGPIDIARYRLSSAGYRVRYPEVPARKPPAPTLSCWNHRYRSLTGTPDGSRTGAISSGRYPPGALDRRGRSRTSDPCPGDQRCPRQERHRLGSGVHPTMQAWTTFDRRLDLFGHRSRPSSGR